MNPMRRAERGMAALEMVLVLLLGTGVLAAVVLLGRLTWHATALQKAVAGTGRFISTLPRETLNTPGIGDVVEPFARIQVQGAALAAGLDTRPSAGSIRVNCTPDGWTCGDGAVTEIQVRAAIRFQDTVFGNAFTGLLPEAGLFFQSEYRQTYVP